MIRTRTLRYATPLIAIGAILATTAGGCGSGGPSKTPATEVVPGATNQIVTCSEVPYDSIAGTQDQAGSGITVAHGLVRGSLWVSCDGGMPDSFSIIVILIRDGVNLNPGSSYKGVPNLTGYEAYTFVNCTPGTYHLYYRFIWKLEGGVQQNTKTVTADRVVTQHDCDS